MKIYKESTRCGHIIYKQITCRAEDGAYRTSYYKDPSLLTFHRDDGPAIIWSTGTKHWYIDGKRHRIGGPASEYFEGGKEWCVNDKHHRLDGPAIIYANGNKSFYINGEYYLEKDYWAAIKFGGFI